MGDHEVNRGGSPQLPCKRDQIKMRHLLCGQAGYPTLEGYLTYLWYPTST